MSSQSLIMMEERLEEVRTLLAFDPLRPINGSVNTSPTKSEIKQSSVVGRAAVVMLCAHLEGFVEDLAVESLEQLAIHCQDVIQVPEMLRTLMVERRHIVPLQRTFDPVKRASRVSAMFTEYGDLWRPGIPLGAMLSHRDLISEMSNPGSNEIDAFLKYLGVNFKDELRARGDLAVVGRVDGLVAKRNQVAHGEVAVQTTHSEIADFVAVVERLAREISDAVARSVQVICELDVLPWPIAS